MPCGCDFLGGASRRGESCIMLGTVSAKSLAQEGDVVVLVTYIIVKARSHGVIYSCAPRLSPG